MWLRGQGGDQFNSLNFQSLGMLPWMQTRVDSLLPVSNQNQQYQALLSSSFQNLRGGDFVNPQLMQFQQPMQYLQQTSSQIPMLQQQQQLTHPSLGQQILQGQSHISKDSLPHRILQQGYFKQEGLPNQQLYAAEALSVHNNDIQSRQQSNISMPSSLGKAENSSANAELSSSSHSPVHSILGSVRPEGIGSLSDISNVNHAMLSKQPSQPPLASLSSYTPINALGDAMSLPSYPGKDASLETGNCSVDVQNHNVFGANLDSSGLMLPMTMPSNYRASSTDTDICSIPSGTPGFHNSMYGCNSSSPELHSEGQGDLQAPRTFVKVFSTCSEGHFTFLFFLSGVQHVSGIAGGTCSGL